MMRFTVLIIILANIGFGVFSHPMREAVESNSTEAQEEQPFGHGSKCQIFFYVQHKLDKCLDQAPMPHEMNTNYLLSEIENACSNSDKAKECMKTEFQECDNWLAIEKLVDNTIGICSTLILSDINQFLTNNKNATVSMECLRFVLDESKGNCKVGEKPKFDGGHISLEKGMDFMQRYFEWYVRCFSTNQHLDEAVQECNGLTRRKVFGIMISSIPATIRGIDINSMYQSIHTFISEPAVQASLAQQAMYYFA